MDVNDNKNSDINFQNMVDKNSVSTINDVLNGNVFKSDDNNKNFNIDKVGNDNVVDEQNKSISCSYCGCCGRLIDSEGNLLGLDGNNKDLLINTFIGKNANKIRKQKFSVCTFVFSYFYLAYRKMYLYSLYLFLFNFVFFYFFVFLLNEFSFVSPIVFYGFWFAGLLIINARISLRFKRIYLKFIKNKIKKFEIYDKFNLNGLIYLCKKKGGTNKFVIVLYILNIILNLLILFYALLLSAAYG